MKLVIKIAAGIILAAVILYFIRLSIIYGFISGVNDAAKDAAEKQKEIAAAREEKIREEQRLKAEQALKAQDEARLYEVYKKRKELAWRNYYSDPEECLVFESDLHMVKCVGKKKAVRREFDRLYYEGKIK
jgi:hypothetical protein